MNSIWKMIRYKDNDARISSYIVLEECGKNNTKTTIDIWNVNEINSKQIRIISKIIETQIQSNWIWFRMASDVDNIIIMAQSYSFRLLDFSYICWNS